MIRALGRFAVTALLLSVAACNGPEPVETFPDFHFKNTPPIALDVAQVQIVDNYHPPFRPPNVEQNFPISPARAAGQWARDRLQAAGTQGLARFVINDASATETELSPEKSGLVDQLTPQQGFRFDAHI